MAYIKHEAQEALLRLQHLADEEGVFYKIKLFWRQMPNVGFSGHVFAVTDSKANYVRRNREFTKALGVCWPRQNLPYKSECKIFFSSIALKGKPPVWAAFSTKAFSRVEILECVSEKKKVFSLEAENE